MLEIDFLFRINFELFVETCEYNQFYELLLLQFFYDDAATPSPSYEAQARQLQETKCQGDA